MERHDLWLYLATGMLGMIAGRGVAMIVPSTLVIFVPNIVTFFGINSILGLFMYKHQDELNAHDHETWTILAMLITVSLMLLIGMVGYQQLEQPVQTLEHMQV